MNQFILIVTILEAEVEEEEWKQSFTPAYKSTRPGHSFNSFESLTLGLENETGKLPKQFYLSAFC